MKLSLSEEVRLYETLVSQIHLEIQQTYTTQKQQF